MESVDIVIVGSGASGAAAAWSLSRSGRYRIVCLEQGDDVDPARYPSTSVDWEVARSSVANPDPNQRRNRADYPIDNSNSPISIANFNGYGDSTILYSGHFPRFHPSDFKTFSLDGVGLDWPLSYEDLEPFFTENETMMGVAGLVGDPAYPDYESLLPPVPLGPMGRRLAEAFNALGWHWWPSYSAINTRSRGERQPCINLGPCNTGCPQGAKASVDQTYWRQARKQGVEVRLGCTVQQVEIDRQGRARGVHYVDRDGVSHLQPASIVILACSGVGTPRLLLNSKSTAFPSGLLNDNDLVGRNLMLHPLGFTEAVFDEDLRSSIGPHGCCILSQQFYETDSANDFVRGYTLHILRGAPPAETAASAYMMRRLPLGRDHHKSFAELFNHTAGIAVITEDLPELDNRIELDPDRTDSTGMPGVKVHYTLSENTKRMMKHGLQRSRDLFETAGGKVTTSFGPVRQTGWHLMGTVRMGDDARTSVVNQFGQAHAVPNIFVVDSSVFVTAGAVNPVATAQALTLRMCNYLHENLPDLSRT